MTPRSGQGPSSCSVPAGGSRAGDGRLGLVRDQRPARIAGLGLLGIAVAKVFIFDHAARLDLPSVVPRPWPAAPGGRSRTSGSRSPRRRVAAAAALALFAGLASRLAAALDTTGSGTSARCTCSRPADPLRARTLDVRAHRTDSPACGSSTPRKAGPLARLPRPRAPRPVAVQRAQRRPPERPGGRCAARPRPGAVAFATAWSSTCRIAASSAACRYRVGSQSRRTFTLLGSSVIYDVEECGRARAQHDGRLFSHPATSATSSCARPGASPGSTERRSPAAAPEAAQANRAYRHALRRPHRPTRTLTLVLDSGTRNVPVDELFVSSATLGGTTATRPSPARTTGRTWVDPHARTRLSASRTEIGQTYTLGRRFASTDATDISAAEYRERR